MPGAWHSTTNSRCSEDAHKVSESISISLAAGESRGERTKAGSDETLPLLVVGVEVKMQVQFQISLILATVALGGNADLSRFVMQ